MERAFKVGPYRVNVAPDLGLETFEGTVFCFVAQFVQEIHSRMSTIDIV